MPHKNPQPSNSAPAAPRQPSQSRRAQLREATLKQAQTQSRRRWLLTAGALILTLLIGYGLWSAAPSSGDTATTAPGFSLPTTDGGTVTLSDLRGGPVILYFNEGAGCGSCTVQMAEIEKNPGFAAAGITVLPIVMNPAEQILPDMETYGVLGKGMHEGLPGHGFVVINAQGVQVWYGDYPSMWLDPDDLLKEATSRLG